MSSPIRATRHSATSSSLVRLLPLAPKWKTTSRRSSGRHGTTILVSVDYGFCAFGLAKVYARADPRNVASVRVLEKLSMQREGLLRSHVVRRGERVDRVYYGLLWEEWEAGSVLD